MASLNLSALGASGPLEALSPLTALTDLRLASNSFSGAALRLAQERSSVRALSQLLFDEFSLCSQHYCVQQAHFLLAHGAASGAC